jgi:tetratricopeptide (TPR) repeat protein
MTMPFARRALGFISLLIALALLSACNRSSPPAAADQQLQHFEGAIDNSKQTYDKVKSDLYVRASRALEAGDAKGAEALYREAVAKYPKDPDGYAALGACLYFQAEYEDAKAEYMRALELNRQSVDAHYGLGCVAHKQKRYDEAREHLEKALALDKDNGGCHRVLAMVYDEIGDRPKAIFHYERAVALDRSIANDQAIRKRLKELKQ